MARKQYLDNMRGKNNVQMAMSLLQKKLRKYTRVGNKTNGNVNFYNHWLDVDVTVTKKEYDYINTKIDLNNVNTYNRFTR